MDWESILVDIVSEVASITKPLLGTPEANESMGKGAGGDITKRIDVIAEDLILKKLKDTNLKIKVITEERGIVYLNCDEGTSSIDHHIIMDPIDGSFNATRNIPFVSISIAVADGSTHRVDDIHDAVVMNIPSGDIFTANKGHGTKYNGEHVSIPNRNITLNQAAMGIDLNPKKKGITRLEYMQEIESIVNAPKKLRILGSNAYGTCLVANGALDVFMDIRGNLRLLDVAGAFLIVTEAGGLVYDWKDGRLESVLNYPLELEQPIAIVAISNLKLMDEIEQKFNGLQDKK